MMKRIVLSIFLVLAALVPASAQFADQATFAGTGAGTANAQTITLSNASAYADLKGVIVKFVPGATNTGDATLTVNGFATPPHIRKPNGTSLVTLSGGEIVSGQPTLVMYDGTYFVLLTPSNLPVGASGLLSSALAYGQNVNLGLSASVNANALTISLKGADGNDPSSTNPVLVPFRNSTIATGTPTVVTQTGALSFTIASGSTMGCVSGEMCRIWIIGVNNGGTLVLGAYNALSGTTVGPIVEGQLQTCQTGTTGGNSAQLYYCSTSAVSNAAIKILGYLEVSEVTAGTWATGPTYVTVFGPGMKKPGDVVQVRRANTATTITTNTQIPLDNTIPQSTEGGGAFSLAITPTSVANLLRVQSRILASDDGSSTTIISSLFRDSGANAVAVGTSTGGAATTLASAAIDYWVKSLTNSSTTFTVNFGSATTNTVRLNATAGSSAGVFGGTANSYIVIEEIMSFNAPANDNTPLSAVG